MRICFINNTNHFPVAFNLKYLPAPFNSSSDPAKTPDQETQQVAHGHNPKILLQGFVVKPMNANQPTHRQPQRQSNGEQDQAESRSEIKGHVQQSQRRPISE